MRHSMKPDLRADYKIRLYTGPQNPFFEVSIMIEVRNFGVEFYDALRRHRLKQRDWVYWIAYVGNNNIRNSASPFNLYHKITRINSHEWENFS